jgi:hypothetical protein
MKAGKNFKGGPSEPTTVSLGTANTGVTAVSYDDGRDVVTVLTLTALPIATITGGGTVAYGKLLYTFPAGAQMIVAMYMALTFDHALANATFKAGIGSVIGSGAVSVLNGTATFMDYITEQNVDSNPGGGTLTDVLLAPTAGLTSGIALNKVVGVKAVHLNVADVWPAGPNTDLTATGTITIKWVKMS